MAAVKKAVKGAPVKAKKKGYSVSALYKVDGDSLKRSKKSCPKCGDGVYMAEHQNRNTCGKCGYTEFKK